MKRIAALTLLALGLIAPLALTGCGDTKSTDIKAVDTKPADKATAK